MVAARESLCAAADLQGLDVAMLLNELPPASTDDVAERKAMYESLLALAKLTMADYDLEWEANLQERRDDLAHEEQRIIVLTWRNSGKVAGFASYRFDQAEREVFLFELHVHPDLQRKKLGTCLRRTVEASALNNDMRTIRGVFNDETNGGVRDFYQSKGNRKTAIRNAGKGFRYFVAIL